MSRPDGKKKKEGEILEEETLKLEAKLRVLKAEMAKQRAEADVCVPRCGSNGCEASVVRNHTRAAHVVTLCVPLPRWWYAGPERTPVRGGAPATRLSAPSRGTTRTCMTSCARRSLPPRGPLARRSTKQSRRRCDRRDPRVDAACCGTKVRARDAARDAYLHSVRDASRLHVCRCCCCDCRGADVVRAGCNKVADQPRPGVVRAPVL